MFCSQAVPGKVAVTSVLGQRGSSISIEISMHVCRFTMYYLYDPGFVCGGIARLVALDIVYIFWGVGSASNYGAS